MAKRKVSGRKAAKGAKDKAAPSFEASLKEVEEVVERLESGEASLDESLALYERGVAALRACRAVLGRAEKRIQILVGENEDGSPILDDFESAPAAGADDGGGGGEDEEEDAPARRAPRRGRESLF